MSMLIIIILCFCIGRWYATECAVKYNEIQK